MSLPGTLDVSVLFWNNKHLGIAHILREAVNTPASTPSQNAVRSIRFEYRYRDYGNYKQFNEIVFANPDQLPLSLIQSFFAFAVTAAFPDADETQFHAEELRLPTLYFDGKRNEDDHLWHEAICFSETLDSASSVETRTIQQFLFELACLALKFRAN